MTEPIDLKKLREICDAATPGPWIDKTDDIGMPIVELNQRNYWSWEWGPKGPEDAKHIATFNPETVGRLLDREAFYRKALENIQKYWGQEAIKDGFKNKVAATKINALINAHNLDNCIDAIFKEVEDV